MNSYRLPRRKPAGVPNPASPNASTTPAGSWSIASLMPEDPRNAGQKATVTATRDPSPIPQPRRDRRIWRRGPSASST